jgi:hypothetical protein
MSLQQEKTIPLKKERKKSQKKGMKVERILHLRREESFLLKGRKIRGSSWQKGKIILQSYNPQARITRLYLGLPWEGMERVENHPRKRFVPSKETLGSQNGNQFEGHK